MHQREPYSEESIAHNYWGEVPDYHLGFSPEDFFMPTQPKWPRLRDIPEAHRKPFSQWLEGQTRPIIEGQPMTNEAQDAFYQWDYDRWKAGLAIVD